MLPDEEEEDDDEVDELLVPAVSSLLLLLLFPFCRPFLDFFPFFSFRRALFSFRLARSLSSFARSRRCFFPTASQRRITCQIALAVTAAAGSSSSPKWEPISLFSF